MNAQVYCGRCGYPLDTAQASCRVCGARAAGQAAGPAGGTAGPAGPAGAAAYASRSGGSRRHPWLAAALSVIPGLGHIYAGEHRKGLVLMGMFGALEVFGFDLDLTAVGAALGIPMELGGFGLWAYSAMDAYRAARAAEAERAYT